MNLQKSSRTWMLLVSWALLIQLPSPGAAWATARPILGVDPSHYYPSSKMRLPLKSFLLGRHPKSRSAFSQSLYLFRAGGESDSEDSDSSDNTDPETDFESVFEQETKRAEEAALAAEATKSRVQTALLNAGLGAMVLWGGITGFVNKGSKISLIAGTIFGGLMVLAGKQIYKNQDGSTSSGYKLGAAVSGLLTVVMGRRYFKTGVYMPTGVIATLAVIALFYNGVDIMVEASERRQQEQQ